MRAPPAGTATHAQHTPPQHINRARSNNNMPVVDSEPEPTPSGTTDLLSLPDDLLRLSLNASLLDDDQASKRAALASCKALARALIRTSRRFGLMLDVDRQAPFLPSVRLFAQLAGEEQAHAGQTLALVLRGEYPARCLAQLRGVRLAGVTLLGLQVCAYACGQETAPEASACAWFQWGRLG